MIDVPDTQLAREATELVRDTTPELIYHHSRRVYLFGARQGRNRDLSFDPELLYVGAMFHDLGLTDSYDRGGCFEQDGAEAAREILAVLGWEPARAETVAEAVYLHMHETTEDDTPEARLLDIGTAADVRGVRIDELGAPARELVLERFPRLGFKEHFVALLEDQARRKPACVVHRYLHEKGAAAQIRAAPFES